MAVMEHIFWLPVNIRRLTVAILCLCYPCCELYGLMILELDPHKGQRLLSRQALLS